MTVQELIDQLSKIEDKSKQVCLYDQYHGIRDEINFVKEENVILLEIDYKD